MWSYSVLMFSIRRELSVTLELAMHSCPPGSGMMGRIWTLQPGAVDSLTTTGGGEVCQECEGEGDSRTGGVANKKK